MERLEVAGPGFINFHLAETWLHDVLGAVVDQGVESYGRSNIGSGRRVIVEFVSANPTGPLHAGHGRGAIFGDALATLLEWCGYVVTRETYINDRGVQMQTYAASLAARAAGETPPDDGYMGQYIIDWAAEMPADADPLEWGYARAIADQKEVLASLGIEFDVWFSEKSLVDDGQLDSALAALRDRGVVFDDDGAVWLRSSEFGDDKDRVLKKSDGEYTYLMPDIAYHANKFDRADELVDVFGADHHGYINRMRAAMASLGHDPNDLEFQITQLVKLMRGSEEVKLSKRSGDLVELRDVVEEVGADSTRFTYLLQSIDSQQTFDLEAAAAQAMDNPVFYTQYAHARIVSIGAQGGRSRYRTAATRRRRPVAPDAPTRNRSASEPLRRRRLDRRRRTRTGAAPRGRMAARAGRCIPRLLPRLLRHRRWGFARTDPGSTLVVRGRKNRVGRGSDPSRGLRSRCNVGGRKHRR